MLLKAQTGPIPPRQLPVPIGPLFVGSGGSSGAVIVAHGDGYAERDDVVISSTARELARRPRESTDRSVRIHVTGMKLMEVDSDSGATEMWADMSGAASGRYSYAAGIQQYAANQQVLRAAVVPLFDGFA